MGKIKLIRNKSFNNQFRKISIFLNNKKVREISNDEIVEINTDEKNNFIYVKLDFYKSQTIEFNLREDEIILLEIVNFKTKYKVIKFVIWFLILVSSPFLSEFNLLLKSIYFILTIYIIIDLIKFLLSMTKYSNNKYISLRKINNGQKRTDHPKSK